MAEEQPRKLNIAIVCDPVTDYVAGSFVSTLRFAELLSSRGHKLIFIAAKSPSNRENNYYKDIKVYRFFSLLLPKTENMFYISFPIIRQVRKILEDEKIDILHVIIPTPSAVVAMRAARELGIKVVAHSHTQPENLFLHLPPIIKKDGLNRIFYKYLSWIYSKADAIIYPTMFAKKQFRHLNSVKKSLVISNGVDTGRFRPRPAGAFLEKYRISAGKRLILFVGRMHPEKSVDTLIRAMPLVAERRPDALLLIIGFGHQEEQLKVLSSLTGADGHVRFLGKLPDEDVELAYASSDIFVLPSLAELEGMVVLEAMSSSLPVIIADSPHSASVDFINGNGFLFRPQDESDLAEKLVRILADERLRAEMGLRSLELSRSYDIRKSVESLEELYNSII